MDTNFSFHVSVFNSLLQILVSRSALLNRIAKSEHIYLEIC